MSHFGITFYGYQNSIKPAVKQARVERAHTHLNYTALPPLVDKNPPKRSIVPLDQTSSYGPGHLDSYLEQERLRTKHTRNPRAPTVIYHYPLAEGHTWGWYNKHQPIKTNLPWTKTKHFPSVHSPMTRFVDTMLVTDKTFSLF